MALVHKITNQIVFTDDNTGAVNEVGIHKFIGMHTTKWQRMKTTTGIRFETRELVMEYGDPDNPKRFSVSQFRDCN